ncbi:MAG: inositol monophosphatase family protein [Gemmatimonadales bacterium]
MSESTYMEAVSEVVRIAGDIAFGHYRLKPLVETKLDGTPVTIADRAAEAAAREWIERRFPDDGILGEEFSDVRPNARRRWIIDPIDGTKSFVSEVPFWGTLVAVADGDEIVAGAAFFPATADLIAAANGCGCWLNGSRSHVSQVADIGAATILTSQSPFSPDESTSSRWIQLEKRSLMSRTWGDCFGYMMVASGRAEVMADPKLSVWDIAPFLPIIREAGGTITDFSGAVTAFGGSAIATNLVLGPTVRDILIGKSNSPTGS